MKSKSILFLLVLLFSLPAMGQKATSKTSWDYPIKPGTEQWNALNSLNAKLSATQIPESVLKSVSTEELVELCANYPLLWDCYAFNSMDEGVKVVMSRFNGLQELARRADNAQCLFSKIERVNADSTSPILDEDSRSEKGLTLCVLLTCLTQDAFLDKMSQALSEQVMRFAYGKMADSSKTVAENGTLYLESSAYLLARSMKHAHAQTADSDILQNFQKSGVLMDSRVIDELAKSYYLTTKTVK